MGHLEQVHPSERTFDVEQFKAAQEKYWQENPRRWDLLVKSGELINGYNKQLRALIEPPWDKDKLKRFVFVYSDDPASPLYLYETIEEKQAGGFATNDIDILNPLQIPFGVFIKIDDRTCEMENVYANKILHELGHNLAYRGHAKHMLDPSDSARYLEEGFVNYLASSGVRWINYDERGPEPYQTQISLREVIFNGLLDRMAVILNRKSKKSWAKAYLNALRLVSKGVINGSFDEFDEVVNEISHGEKKRTFLELLEKSYQEYRNFKGEDYQLQLYNFIAEENVSSIDEIWVKFEETGRKCSVTPHLIWGWRSPLTGKVLK